MEDKQGEKTDKSREMILPPSRVQGFNYQPSYSSCAFETWRCFQEEAIQREIARGKELFPKMNTIRVWLSWNAWARDPELILDRFETTLDILQKSDLLCIPVLFNRWHDPVLDCDGVYIDHFYPGSSWLQKNGYPMMGFVEDLGRRFGADSRILVWDLCNEPFSYDDKFKQKDEFLAHELNWLKKVAECLRSNGATQPFGVGTHSTWCDPLVNEFVDVFLTHMYFCIAQAPTLDEALAKNAYWFDWKIKKALEYADSVGKPLFTTECCWGDFDDTLRVRIIETSLQVLKANKIGSIAHALYESDFADLHRPELGRTSPDVGRLEFILKDGTLRPGHDVINRYFD